MEPPYCRLSSSAALALASNSGSAQVNRAVRHKSEENRCQHGCHTEKARIAQRVAEQRLTEYENSADNTAKVERFSKMHVDGPGMRGSLGSTESRRRQASLVIDLI